MAGGAEIHFSGRVATGLGIAVSFTSAPWARTGFISLVGIDPHPGTLNLKIVDDQSCDAWAALRAWPGRHLPAPDSDACDARLYSVTLAGKIPGAIVLPEVLGYPADQVEIIAAVHLRDALGLADGDSVTITADGN